MIVVIRKSILIVLAVLVMLASLACQEDDTPDQVDVIKPTSIEPKSTVTNPIFIYIDGDPEYFLNGMLVTDRIKLMSIRPTTISRDEAIRCVEELWNESPAGLYGHPDVGVITAKLVERMEKGIVSDTPGILCWLVMAPLGFRLTVCGPDTSEEDLHATCWVGFHWGFVDAETGAIISSGESGMLGPQVTLDEMQVVLEYQDTHGAWVLWDAINAYNSNPLPNSIVDQLNEGWLPP